MSLSCIAFIYRIAAGAGKDTMGLKGTFHSFPKAVLTALISVKEVLSPPDDMWEQNLVSKPHM